MGVRAFLGGVVLEKLLEYQFQPEHLAIFLTLIYLEAVLSFDNAAVLAAMIRPLPVEKRRKALLYGLVGAYTFRVLAIIFAAIIIENPLLKILGGAYLLYLPIRHFWPESKNADGAPKTPARVFGLSVFWSTVVYVELMDLAFALDQVIVAVALTDEILLIILASMIAILFLRISASYMARIMDWFPMLEALAYIVVGIVGLRLLYEEALHLLGACESFLFCPVPRAFSIAVSLGLLVLPVIGKLAYDRLRRDRPGAVP